MNKNRKKGTEMHNEDQILNTSIPYGVEANNSPQIIINSLFYQMKENSILLKHTQV